MLDLAVTRRETSGKEALGMPGFPSGLTGMGDGTEIIWRSVPLASFLAVVVEYSRLAKRGVPLRTMQTDSKRGNAKK